MPTVDEHKDIAEGALEPVAPVEECTPTSTSTPTPIETAPAEPVKENVAGEGIPLKRSGWWRRFLSCFITK